MTNFRLFLGLIFILIGISAITSIPLTKYLFAFILIYVGLKIMTRKHDFSEYKSSKTTTQDHLNEVGIFTALFRKVKTADFAGGKVTLIFAGGEIDLTETKTKEKEIEMDVTAIFGGVKIIVPKDWKVDSEGVGIIGGYNNSTAATGAKTSLKIKGAAIMGGVEIVN